MPRRRIGAEQGVARLAQIGDAVPWVHLADVSEVRADPAEDVGRRLRERVAGIAGDRLQGRRAGVVVVDEVVVRQIVGGQRRVVDRRGAHQRRAAGPPADQHRREPLRRNPQFGGPVGGERPERARRLGGAAGTPGTTRGPPSPGTRRTPGRRRTGLRGVAAARRAGTRRATPAAGPAWRTSAPARRSVNRRVRNSVGEVMPRTPGCETPSLNPKCSCPRSGPGRASPRCSKSTFSPCVSAAARMRFTSSARSPGASAATITSTSATFFGPPTVQFRLLPAAALSDGSPRNSDRSASPWRKLWSPNASASAGVVRAAIAACEKATLTHVDFSGTSFVPSRPRTRPVHANEGAGLVHRGDPRGEPLQPALRRRLAAQLQEQEVLMILVEPGDDVPLDALLRGLVVDRLGRAAGGRRRDGPRGRQARPAGRGGVDRRRRGRLRGGKGFEDFGDGGR